MLVVRRIVTAASILTLVLALAGGSHALSQPKDELPKGAADTTTTTLDTTTTTLPPTTTTTTLPPETTTTIPADTTTTVVQETNDTTTTTLPTTTTTLPPDDGGDGGEVAEAELTATAEELLVQVGDDAHFNLRVTNPGPHKLEGAVVIGKVPAELGLPAVPILDGVDAVAVNTPLGGGTTDIVWVLGELKGGEAIDLPWQAPVQKPGDFRALAEAKLKVPDARAKSAAAETFLATSKRAPADNPVPLVPKKVVTYKSVKVTVPGPPVTVPAAEADRVAGAPSGLPNTGSDPLPFVFGGFALIGLGVALAFMPRRRMDPRILMLALAVLMAACVASDPPSDVASQGEEAATTAGPSPSPSPSDTVLGKRIENEEDEGEGQSGGEPDGGQDGGPAGDNGNGTAASTSTTLPVPSTVAVQPEPVTVTSLVRQVEVVEVPAEDLPSDRLASRRADNTLTMDWSDGSGIERATSSVLIGPDDGVEIVSSVSEGAGTVEVVVVLRNTTADRRVVVRGRVLHEVTGPGGAAATLSSGPLDIVLNPGGEVTEHFSYLLPTGSYNLGSSFRSE